MRVAAACGSGTVACGEELQGALSASGRAGTWRSRQGALRKPESGGLRAPPPPALPPGGAGCRWRAQRTATEAGTGGGECGREAPRRADLCRGSRGATPERCPRCWDREAGAGFQAAGVSPATKLFPLSTRSPVSTSPYALPALGVGGVPVLRSVSPFSALHPRSLPAHPLFTLKPSHAYLLPIACRSLLPPSSAPTVPAATPTGSHCCPRAPAARRSGNLSSGVPLLPAVPKQRCPGRRRLQLHGLPRGVGLVLGQLPAARRAGALGLAAGHFTRAGYACSMFCLGQCGYFCLVNLDRMRFLKKKPALPHTNMEQVFFAAVTGCQ